jgi:hypothetical protein
MLAVDDDTHACRFRRTLLGLFALVLVRGEVVEDHLIQALIG